MEKKSLSWWAMASCFVSLLSSVVAVCVAVWRSPELSFDYQGVIVGVLSLLVTVLIGWNIYSVIDLRGTKKKMDEMGKSLENEIKSRGVAPEDRRYGSVGCHASISLHRFNRGYAGDVP